MTTKESTSGWVTLATWTFASLCILTTVAAQASVPGLISYQGMLTDESGVPVNAAVSFTFSVYDVPTGGTPLWTENQTVTVSNGIFNVLLGSVTPFDSHLFAQDILYLGVKAGADQEMAPRQQITSSAYAHKAELSVPIGTILPWVKSIPGTPALWDGWVECNGQVLADPKSPYDGETVPDLNGVGGTPRFLRGGTTSGSVGGSESHSHTLSTRGQWEYYTSPYYTLTEPTTGYTSTLPSYYSVVWIMRVK